MKLSATDVFRLYGGRIYVLPGSPDSPEQTPQAPEEPSPESADPVEAAPSSPAEVPSASSEPTTAQPEPAPAPTDPEPEAIREEAPAAPAEVVASSPVGEEKKPIWLEGQEVVWKMKAQAKIALVMSTSDFKNRALTIGLKDCVVRAGIDTSLVGFGILPDSAPPADFRKQPVPFALVFSSAFDSAAPAELGEGRQLWGQVSVAEVVLSAPKQDELVQRLKTLANQL